MSQNLKDWPEDSHLENGNYSCICILCGHHFVGYKRRTVCKECAFSPDEDKDV